MDIIVFVTLMYQTKKRVTIFLYVHIQLHLQYNITTKEGNNYLAEFSTLM